MAKGYDLEDIQSLPTVIPNVVMAEGGNVIFAENNYKELDRGDFEDNESYYDAVSERIERLTVKERLEPLYSYFHREEEDVIALIRLSNIKGKIEFQIGNICVYSPILKKYIKEDAHLSKIENVDERYFYLNAAIPIKHLSFHSSKNRAKEKICKVLDLLALGLNGAKPIGIMENELVLVKNGREIGQSDSVIGNDPRYAERQQEYSYWESLDANEYLDDFRWIAKHFGNLNEVKNVQVYNSMHWFYKATQADKLTDVLLFSWFSLESLLKIDEKLRCLLLYQNKGLKGVLPIIQEIVCAVFAKYTFYHKIWHVYENLVRSYTSNDNYYDIPESIAQQAALDLLGGDKYRLHDFVNHFDKVIECVNDEVEKDRLLEVLEFYKNRSPMEDYLNNLRCDLLMICRLRNMIVHNALITSVNMKNYAQKARYISGVILRHFMSQLKKNPKASNFDVMVEIVASGKVFLESYEIELKKLHGL